MRHSCRCGLHPVLSLIAIGTVGGVLAIGLQLWLEPWTGAVAVALGALAGLFVSNGIGASLAHGLVLGAALALLAIGVRALVTIARALQRPPSMTSRGAWLAR